MYLKAGIQIYSKINLLAMRIQTASNKPIISKSINSHKERCNLKHCKIHGKSKILRIIYTQAKQNHQKGNQKTTLIKHQVVVPTIHQIYTVKLLKIIKFIKMHFPIRRGIISTIILQYNI